jgi:pyridoxine 4-dehydrogenase
MPKIIPIPGATSAERIMENSKEVEDRAAVDRLLKEFPLVGDRLPASFKVFLDTTEL